LGFEKENVTLGQVVFPVHLLSAARIMPPMTHSYLNLHTDEAGVRQTEVMLFRKSGSSKGKALTVFALKCLRARARCRRPIVGALF
jgi:hypothetical protein